MCWEWSSSGCAQKHSSWCLGNQEIRQAASNCRCLQVQQLPNKVFSITSLNLDSTILLNACSKISLLLVHALHAGRFFLRNNVFLKSNLLLVFCSISTASWHFLIWGWIGKSELGTIFEQTEHGSSRDRHLGWNNPIYIFWCSSFFPASALCGYEGSLHLTELKGHINKLLILSIQAVRIYGHVSVSFLLTLQVLFRKEGFSFRNWTLT